MLMLECMVDGGGDVRRRRDRVTLICQTQDGSTALVLAAEGGQVDCVRLLVEAGADKDTINNVRALHLTFALLCWHEHQRFE